MINKKIWPKIFLIYSYIVMGVPYAWGLTAAELQQKILEQDGKLMSAQFEYVQEMRSSQTPEMIESKGKVYYQRPKKLRIEMESPERQVIVTQGKSVFIYTPRFNQVLKTSWKNWSEKDVFLLLPGFFGSSGALEQLKKDYVWNVESRENLNDEETVAVRLQSSAQDSNKVVSLWLGAEDFVPRKVQVASESLLWVISLVSLKLNGTLDPQIFKFSPPKDAALIHVP